MAIAAYTDLKFGKVYNALILVGLISGMILRFPGGESDIRQAFMSIGISVALLLPIYLCKGIGAGDVKLFAAIAAFLNCTDMVQCIILSFLIGGVISIIFVVKNKSIKQTIHFALPIFISTVFISGGVI